ncbi:MAG: DUF6515 family protein [Candidatus Omnitrophota bacterium]|jgi:hypothetical protein
MRSKRDSKKILGLFLLVSFLLSQAPDVYAQSRGRGRPGPHQDYSPEPYYTPHYASHGKATHDLPGGYIRLIMGGLEYFYWEGMFYRMKQNQYIVVPAPVGAVVTAIPQGSRPVVIDGTPYYNINGVTYMYTPYGYQVVPQPKKIVINNYAVEQKDTTKAVDGQETPSSAAEESFTINVPNHKGGYTAVILKRSGEGFTGPQGEYYTEFPRVEQLKVMYAK